MGLHKKHLPLDTAVHGILFGVMLANAAFILAELVCPPHFLLSCGRVASTLVQAGWFFMATHMIFDGEVRRVAGKGLRQKRKEVVVRRAAGTKGHGRQQAGLSPVAGRVAPLTWAVQVTKPTFSIAALRPASHEERTAS